MAPSVIYSLSEKNGAPSWMWRVNSTTNTPLIATGIATSIALAPALFFPLKTLTSITSFIMLLVFVASNLALIPLERLEPEVPFDTPKALPWVGLIHTVGLIIASFFVMGGGH